MTVWLLAGFLAGSVPFGWIVTRAKGIDIRQVGSGNIGATNVLRALGWGWGGLVLVLDMLKGLLPLIGLRLCLLQLPEGLVPVGGVPGLVMGVGVAAILGHTFTPWLRFKGGKGIATGLGVIIAVMGWWALAPLAAFTLIVVTTRMVSLGSLFAATLVTATIFTVPTLRAYWPLGVITLIIVLWTHRGNIERILDGTENRLGQKKPPAEADSAAEDQPENQGGDG
ncbi:glycerol-3-phosphate 1-O-acyltransferase PlsY [bacterium]|nr:glycerol-3-phosphate 1-O-acyltransferase PlsY [bacterium]